MVQRTLPDGTTFDEQIPLTLEDALHPQEGDYIMESDIHDLLRHYIASVFRWRTADDPGALILSDTGIYWNDPLLPYTHHCPDVAAIFGIQKRKSVYPSFSVGKEGVRPRLIVELVSPNTRSNDVVTKVAHYHEVEIPMYVIADRDGYDDPWRLLGYSWRPDAFVPIPTDARGRIWLDAVGVWLGADGTRLICYDRNGAEIGDYVTVQKELENQLRALDAVKQRADADQRIREAEQKAREAVEAKMKELEAELARLRGQ
jgi:Uma2 family endonuclease